MILHCFWRAAVPGVVSLVLGTPSVLLAGEAKGAPKRSTDETGRVSLPEERGFRARTNSALGLPVPGPPDERKLQAERLISLYKEIGDAKEVVPAERSRLQTRLKARLVRLANAIALDIKPARYATPPQTGNSSSNDDQPSANRSSIGAVSMAADTPSMSQVASTGANGGGRQDDGQALVDLIQATIAPQSWDVNGGPGSIVYWPAWHVLVVRQTDDVHEQIGGVMHGVRK